MNELTEQDAKQLDRRVRPSYVKVRNWLLDYITKEKLEPGDRIPSERLLADSMGFSRATIAKAVSVLVAENVLTRQERSGTYVGDRARPRRNSGVRTIGIMMPWLSQDALGQISAVVDRDSIRLPYWRESMHLEVIHGALSVLNEHGYRFLVLPSNSVRDEAKAIEKLAGEGLDGVLVMPNDSQANASLFSELIENGTPIVFVDRYCPNVKADWVATDNFGGAKDAVKYLIDRGHRRIAYLTDFGTRTSTDSRYDGYKAALEEAGIPFDENIVCGPQVVRHGWWRLDHAVEHCRSIADPITAVFCMNDTVVLATLDATKRLGVAVPADLEIMGFFDDHFSYDIRTPFARMKQDTAQMGKLCAELLIARISGEAPDEPQHILLPAHVVPPLSEQEASEQPQPEFWLPKTMQ